MNESEITKKQVVGIENIQSDLDLTLLETKMCSMLDKLKLPSDSLLAPVKDRAAMVNNVDGVLSVLDLDTRSSSFYISKMIAAATVGLFDAALNYLWDELVSSLRKKVVSYDLEYFFDNIANNNSDFRKTLKSENDLSKINDEKLLSGSLKIGLISESGYKRLGTIRYLRNNASAAHPNEQNISGLELVTYLEQCINEVINVQTGSFTLDIGRLLSNIKKNVLNETDEETAKALFSEVPRNRADTLANGFFGLYTSVQTRTPIIADNVLKLWPCIWPFIHEQTKYDFGMRQATLSVNGDTDKAAAALDLLDLVQGSEYLSPSIRAQQISETLELLYIAHTGYNNFYNEPVPARNLLNLIGKKGDVPTPVRDRYISTLIYCFLGNSYGICAAADPIYREMLQRFSSQDAGIGIRLFTNSEISLQLGTPTGEGQWSELLEILGKKVTNTTDRDLFTALKSFNGKPANLHNDSEIKRILGRKA